MATFLLKTEPSVFSYDDLVRDKKATWDGVANAAALIHLRSIRKGDEAFIYHTGDERAVVGLALVTSNPYEDPGAPGLTKDGLPKAAVVDLKPGKAIGCPVKLEAIKKDPAFAGFDLVRVARLSVMVVPPLMDRRLRELGRIK